MSSLPQALAFVLKRSKPGELKADAIKKTLEADNPLTGFSDKVAALIDSKTGNVSEKSANQVRRIASKHPVLFSTVDIEKYLPEPKKNQAEEKPAARGAADKSPATSK